MRTISCNDCNKIQKDNLKGINCAYYRVGNGNVLIGACDKHFNMLRQSPDREVVRFSMPKKEVM